MTTAWRLDAGLKVVADSWRAPARAHRFGFERGGLLALLVSLVVAVPVLLSSLAIIFFQRSPITDYAVEPVAEIRPRGGLGDGGSTGR